MLERMRLLWKKQFKLFFIFIVFLSGFIKSAFANELYVQPVVQNIQLDDLILILDDNKTYWITPKDLGDILKIKFDSNNDLSGSFMGNSFTITPDKMPLGSYQKKENQYYFPLSFYEKLFDIQMEVNPFEMQILIKSNKNLPLTTALLLKKRQQSFLPMPQSDTFQNYEFDNRFLSTPVIDTSIQKGFYLSDYNGSNEKKFNSTAYEMNMGMLLGGLDTYASVFGDNNNFHYNPRARLTVGRTFLDHPENKLNLTEFEAGDVTGFNSTLFNNSTNGRGAYASSFKDLVLSADKTINLSGPLSDGWQVELYQNNQLIGFRQTGIGGQYLFSNIPVSYGLNVFKLVFYGPYGEIQTQEREYYSGTSPVKTGKFGYIVNAYQKNRYLFEQNEPSFSPSTKGTLDMTGYYGLTDTLTLIGGTSRSPDAITEEERDYFSLGSQAVLSGASLQYNALYGSSNQKIGHHTDLQGNIYIGDIFARYDYYGELYTPISYYNERYLKDIAETRLTGYIPFGNLPYYVSYLQGHYLNNNDKLQEVHTRLSPNFMRYYNISIENTWYKDPAQKYDDVGLLFQAQYGDLGFHSQIKYRIDPSTYLNSLNQQVDYRWSKYTYFQANWDHDCRSNYSSNHDLDTFSISAGRLFSFGGLTVRLSADTDRNAGVFLTYNISLGKVPDQSRFFTNAQNKMSKRSTIHARVTDEADNPIPGAKVSVSGLQDPVIADEKGEVVFSDIEPYAKTIMKVDPESVEDLALVPSEEEKKLVLRPGTVLPIQLRYVHQGGIEGWIKAPDTAQKYRIDITNDKGEIVQTKYPQEDGSFIFDELTFGNYHLLIKNSTGEVLIKQPLKINQAFVSLNQPILIP